VGIISGATSRSKLIEILDAPKGAPATLTDLLETDPG
jgi:uncharacterized protein YggU (UPF0235/DUF167 family)